MRQAIETALHHHTAGRLEQAEKIYRQILQADPLQPQALHFLGLIAHQVGHNESAVELITKALSIDSGIAAAHNNLGNALRDLGRLEDAVVSCRKAIAIQPDFAEAHNNLGNALRDLGRLDEAIASFNRALAIRPDYVQAHSNLGSAFRELGRLEDAVASNRRALAINPQFAGGHSNLGNALRDLGDLEGAVSSYRKALAARPDYAPAHNNLGNALRDLGEPEEAVASFRRALAINPNFAEAHKNLGDAYLDLGKRTDAFGHYRSAIALDPQNDLFWPALASSLDASTIASDDDSLWPVLSELLERPSVRPSTVVDPIIIALRRRSDFSQLLALRDLPTPLSDADCWTVIERLSAFPVLLQLMRMAPIGDLAIEAMLATARRALLVQTLKGAADEEGLAFKSALAVQCFTNEYVYAESDDETAGVAQLEQKAATAIAQNLPISPTLIAVLGAYRPLRRFDWANDLADRPETDAIRDLIVRTVVEPLQELALRSRIRSLTPIKDDVSQVVRAQYEESPYPRWIRAGINVKSGAIGAILRSAPYLLDLAGYHSPENPDILVAGCGTGQQAIEVASKFANARVLAVDLSLSSLSYAVRKTQELGVENIDYAQADILALGALDRRFDLIESVGVLHHLGDPMAGWRVLADLLRPGGIMKIGLYSELARQDVVAGRALIAERGYSASPEDIRRCRQEIAARAEEGNPEAVRLCASKDFFSLSECRDLLFHVQEHRFTLPQIESALQILGLRFLGFGFATPATLARFKQQYPDRDAMTNLSLWHAFERENPDTFLGMYQFWCQKT